MATGQDWIDATRRNLLGGFTETRNQLTNAYTAGQTTITLTQPMGNIVAGAILSIGLNIFYVWSVVGQVATVIGGQNGSTDINLLAGTLVRVNPKFTDWDIWQALTNDLNDLSSPTNGLFGVNTTSWTYNAATTGYDLGTLAATNLLDLYEVRYVTPGPEKDEGRLPTWAYTWNRQAYTTDIPSGIIFQLNAPSGMTPGYKFWAVWKSVLIMPASPTADASASCLQASAFDVPPLGAAIALMAGQEIKRNFIDSQGGVRRATEVPAGAVQASANGLRQLRKERINSEASRLMRMYGYTKD